LGQTGLNWPIS